MSSFPGYILSDTIPPKKEVVHFTEGLIDYLFPVVEDKNSFLLDHPTIQSNLKKSLLHILTPIYRSTDKDIMAIAEVYFEQLSSIKNRLLADAQFILSFDPAAYSLEEVIITYPGFAAITVYRLAHALYELEVPLVPRMISEWIHSKTGIDISAGATIGCPFFIDHGTGIVIGETSHIGDCVKIYQGVTLGALAVKKEDAQSKRHPTIEDNVVVYAGSTILGGHTVIGHDSIIGGNTWLTQSIAPFSVVYHKGQNNISHRKEFTEPLNFII
jgi:serine O-acetyltransferase